MAFRRARPPVAPPRAPVRGWIAPLFAIAGVGLLPWTIWLSSALPATHGSEHWDIVWSGFDSALAVAFVLVALAAWRRSLWLEAAAAATGTMLLCDAWFDIMLESRSGLWFAITQAVIVEIPFAGFCFWLARDSERFFSRKHAILDGGRELAAGDEPTSTD